MARRRNTVHDLSALQLHPDGSRVHITDRQSRYLARDARGNRIAVDAGGSGTVKKRKRAKSEDKAEEQQEEIDIELNASAEELQSEHDSDPEDRDKGKGKDKDKPEKPKDPRTKKRLKHQQEHEFSGSRNPVTRLVEMPPPSADLLKCIHYQATAYYSERGELLNATKHARREKKRRRLEKLKQKGIEVPEDEEDSETEGDSEDSEESSNNSRANSTLSKGRDTRAISGEPIRDMYKMFDGSALMALGILFQENLGELLQPMLAAEWERSIGHNQDDDYIQDFNRGHILFQGQGSSQKDLESGEERDQDSDFSPSTSSLS